MKHVKPFRTLLISCVLALILASCEDPFSFIQLTDEQLIVVQNAVDNHDQGRMNTYLIDFYHTEYSNSERLSYLETQAALLGLDTRREIFGSNYDNKDTNIIMEKPGTNPLLAPVYVTAHWDTYFNPGADDNASGCAGILELAACIAGLETERDIYFVIFGEEEHGLIGSTYHVANLSRRPVAIYNFEMIGFTSSAEVAPELMHAFLGLPRYGDFIGVFANPPSRNLGMHFIRMIDLYAPELKYFLGIFDENLSNNKELEDLYRSDHGPFWDAGIPALFITDTAELREGSPYHSYEDTLDKINLDFMGSIVKATAAAVLYSAGVEAP